MSLRAYSSEQALDAVARLVRRYNLVTPALLALEGARPLNRALPLGLTAIMPVLELFASHDALAALRDALEEPDGLEQLRSRLVGDEVSGA